jgi:hypothetical protein
MCIGNFEGIYATMRHRTLSRAGVGLVVASLVLAPAHRAVVSRSHIAAARPAAVRITSPAGTAYLCRWMHDGPIWQPLFQNALV